MSADDWQRIVETNTGKYELYYGSGESEKLESTHDTLREAIVEADKTPTEYGMSFNLLEGKG